MKFLLLQASLNDNVSDCMGREDSKIFLDKIKNNVYIVNRGNKCSLYLWLYGGIYDRI